MSQGESYIANTDKVAKAIAGALKCKWVNGNEFHQTSFLNMTSLISFGCLRTDQTKEINLAVDEKNLKSCTILHSQLR